MSDAGNWSAAIPARFGKNILHSLKWVHLLPDVCWYWHHFFGACVLLFNTAGICVFVHVCWFYLDNVFWAAGPSEPYMVWWSIITIRGVMWKDWFAVFKVKVTAKASVIKMWLLMLWTANPFAANIVWWYMIIAGVSCEEIGSLFSRSEVWFVCLRSQSQQRVKNSSECSSKWYFLNCRTFCNQTYYSGAPSWTEVPFKKVTVKVAYKPALTFYHILSTAFLTLWQPNSFRVHQPHTAFRGLISISDPLATKQL